MPEVQGVPVPDPRAAWRMWSVRFVMSKNPVSDTPKILDTITDVVLAYKPKPKTKAQKRRARKTKKAKGKD